MFAEMTELDIHGSYFVPFRARRDSPAAAVNYLTPERLPGFDLWHQTHAEVLRLYAIAVHERIFALAREEGGMQSPNPLGQREREVLQWLGSGLQHARIAERRDISPRTVEFHLNNARRKLGAASREHALAKALLDGFIEL